ncbi:DUF805 domain-containing protein [Altererythrobacter xixiisoli]|uniref:DUF805 domain-containing protein n=1 Tax=Croceibacterium xixiisoli TaxID=1476466 RepID=A0A6I4TTQ3_9SPHN|nr:DUF805 domain-containing protein [Croceibacterium xixiisoli]MXO98247.1 DUF805 domain-containing protein [Croceibacterium xixiisoli]
MLKWMMMPLRRYAEFSGRSRRMEYWSFSLGVALVVLLLMVPVFVVGGLDTFVTNPSAGMGMGAMLPLSLVGILMLAILIPSIAVTVRRLHDLNLTGWIYLGVIILSYIPFLGIVISIGFIVAMFWPGTVGANKYGPDPKSSHDADVFI